MEELLGGRDQLNGLPGSCEESRWSKRRMRRTGCVKDW